MQGLGYKELVPCLAGQSSPGEAMELMARRTRNYAKRQLTWFKADNRITWLRGGDGQQTNLQTILEDMARA